MKFGLATRLLILAIVMLAVGAVAIWVSTHFELVSLNMAVVALVVCVVSTQIAHIAGEYPSGDDNFAARLASSMFARTCPPFLAVVLAKAVDQIPFERGFVFLIVLFYLVGLVADITLHVLRTKKS